MSTAYPEIIVINGTPVDVTAVPIHTSILDFLRCTGRTGSKIGCNEGDCGACTLLLLENDSSPRAINGCLSLVPSLVGREIITAEGLAKNGELHPVQKAMVECNGSQCGYYTPGFISSMAELHQRQVADPAAIAGATELAVLIHKRHVRYPALISLDGIPSLHEINTTDSHWEIGAAAPLTDVEKNSLANSPSSTKSSGSSPPARSATAPPSAATSSPPHPSPPPPPVPSRPKLPSSASPSQPPRDRESPTRPTTPVFQSQIHRSPTNPLPATSLIAIEYSPLPPILGIPNAIAANSYHTDGRLHGGTEMGQGLHTKILGIAMRELGLPVGSIRLMHTRTDKVPNTSATAASSGSDLNGMAVADACRQLRERLIPLAAEILQCSTSAVQFGGGQVHGSSGTSIPFETLTAIDHGQIEGGFVQGMGWLTSEELKWDENGKLLTHSASTYAIPAFSDAPADFRVALLTEATQPNTIHGSKAVGEPPLMLAISVREAIRDAVSAFGKTDFLLPSPSTGEAVKSLIP